MNKSGKLMLVGVGSVSLLALVAAGQPERKARVPDAREGEFYPKYHVTQSQDGRRVYLWGFDPETAEIGLVAQQDAPENWKDYGAHPGNYRDYHFATSADGKHLFVWGYNPGEGLMRLVNASTAEDAAVMGQDRDRLRKEREQREQEQKKREQQQKDRPRR